MSYKIALASTDGKYIDVAFGEAKEFFIYEVHEDGTFEYTETRPVKENLEFTKEDDNRGCKDSGCFKYENGCVGQRNQSVSVSLLKDCRIVICKKIGFHIQKQLEKNAISSFEIVKEIIPTLVRITSYFYLVDHHKNLRELKNIEKDISIAP